MAASALEFLSDPLSVLSPPRPSLNGAPTTHSRTPTLPRRSPSAPRRIDVSKVERSTTPTRNWTSDGDDNHHRNRHRDAESTDEDDALFRHSSYYRESDRSVTPLTAANSLSEFIDRDRRPSAVSQPVIGSSLGKQSQ